MITKFKIFENYKKSGIFGLDIKGKYMSFSLNISEDDRSVKIMYDDALYIELSIEIPGSEELEPGEFFLNPDVDRKIVEELVEQNFIDKGNKTAVAGDQNTISYRLI